MFICRVLKMRAEEVAPNLDELKEQWDAAGLPEELEALEAFRDERVSGSPRQNWGPTSFGEHASLLLLHCWPRG